MKLPTIEAVKAYTTYGLGAFVVISGMFAIYQLRDLPDASATVAIFAGFVGSALTFMFGQEVQTRTARQAESATAASTAATAAATAASSNGHGTPAP